jgi:hypothetical protein
VTISYAADASELPTARAGSGLARGGAALATAAPRKRNVTSPRSGCVVRCRGRRHIHRRSCRSSARPRRIGPTLAPSGAGVRVYRVRRARVTTRSAQRVRRGEAPASHLLGELVEAVAHRAVERRTRVRAPSTFRRDVRRASCGSAPGIDEPRRGALSR